jgi:hypothetical protein
MVSVAGVATGFDRGRPGGLLGTRERASRHDSARRALSAANSRISFSRVPGTLGTVANADSGKHHF